MTKQAHRRSENLLSASLADGQGGECHTSAFVVLRIATATRRSAGVQNVRMGALNCGQKRRG